MLDADVVVVGAGGAGLWTALTAARLGGRVVLVSATPLAQTASYWAQGGIAAALAPDDSPDLHLRDTESAGRGLVRRSAARALVREAPGIVAELQASGVVFDEEPDGTLQLGLEGGHGKRRVAKAGGSATGRRITRQLAAALVETPGVTVHENARAARLWTTDGRTTGVVLEDGRAISARAVVLSTGGYSALWRRTTNPPGSIGIGLRLAREAGAALADLEFVQFHPTAVTGVAGREGFLVTEAIRGEGATLHGPDGERFVEELAPRDHVARAIWLLMREHGLAHVELDMTHVDPRGFPNVVEVLQASGIDPTRDRIPVAPAAHYCMGGVVADLDGATTVPGLYAAGETACTGLHGANRLASNSLSECFVFGGRAARAAMAEPDPRPGTAPDATPIRAPSREDREALWQHAGILRQRAELEHLLGAEDELVRLVARCALLREETRGGHARADFPELDLRFEQQHAVVRAGCDDPLLERWL